MNFVIENKELLLSISLFVISEFMSLYPKSKSNGILQLIFNLLKLFKKK